MQRYYTDLHMIGAALMFERLAKIASARNSDWKKSGFSWIDNTKSVVPFKRRLEWLFISAGVPTDLKGDVGEIRNSISHGDNFDLPMAGNIQVQRALTQLAFLCILGLCGFKGSYQAHSVWPMSADFPGDVAKDVDRLRKPIATYAAEIVKNK
jgi:hypothetical protein